MSAKHRKARPPIAPPRPAPRPPLPAWKKALFSAVTLVLALALLEGAARLVTSAAPNLRWESHRRLLDATGFPRLNEILVPEPALFWTLRPNLERYAVSGRLAASSELQFTVSTDASGNRRLPAPSAGRPLVAFLGDSCTFGVGVEGNQVFPALLQQQLDVGAVNLGVPGYTAYQGHRRLATYPFPTAPRIVVVSFGFNDSAPWDGLSDREHAERLSGGGSWLQHSRLLSSLAALRRPAASSAAPASARRPRLTDPEFADELREIARWSRERKIAVVLLVWPFRGQMAQVPLTSKQRVVAQVGEAEGVEVVDLLPVFRVAGGPVLF
ncbi:MAG: SGNH/GDSL hydrolase family protein, partial [Acidobacteria bacterium]